MKEIFTSAPPKETVILVGTDIDKEQNIVETLAELDRLVETAGGEVVGTIIQRRERPDIATYMAKASWKNSRRCSSRPKRQRSCLTISFRRPSNAILKKSWK